MSTVSMGPTLSNPQAFETLDELRAELHRANEKLLCAAEQAHQLAVQHNAVLEWVSVIAALHEDGGHDEVKKCLDNVVANKNRMQGKQH